MSRRWKRHKATRPLSNRAIVLGIVVVLGVGAAAFTVLLRRYSGAGTGAELDAIRTAGALTVAAGGAATLLLAARRQAHTERDSSEQRITELYTRAVDQLGAKEAPVRLGGLHALERLAQNNPAQRQTIVDVICAYLRMPYTPPDDHAPGEDAPEDAHNRYEQRRQELQVRLTAQHILTAHLQPAVAAVFWVDIDLNLIEAHLHQLDLSACQVRNAQFNWATFAGAAGFEGATFAGYAWFSDATFTGSAEFEGVTFAGYPEFDGARVALSSPTPWRDRARRPEHSSSGHRAADTPRCSPPTPAPNGAAGRCGVSHLTRCRSTRSHSRTPLECRSRGRR